MKTHIQNLALALCFCAPLATPLAAQSPLSGYTKITPNYQTGTSFTFVTGNAASLVSFANASAIAGALGQAGTASFPAGWYMDVQNTGAGTLTITPTTSTIDGAATLVLTTGSGARIVSDGTNWATVRGGGGTTTNIWAVPTTGWTLVNGAVLSNVTGDVSVLAPQSSFSPINWRYVTRTLPSPPYSVIFKEACNIPNETAQGGVTAAWSCAGITLSDGTKFENIELTNGGGALPGIQVRTMNDVNNTGAVVLLGPTTNLTPASNVVFKLSDSGTTRTWSYFTNGAFVTFLSEATNTFLTPTRVGFGGLDLTNNSPADYSYVSVDLKGFCQSTATTCNGL